MRSKSLLVGNLKSECPYCSHPLEKRPGRKKKCPHCGNYIYVRTRPADGQRVLVTEKQAGQIEEQWSIKNGTHAAYLAEKKRLADTKSTLTAKWGREPTKEEIQYHLLNEDLVEHAQQGQWGLFRNARLGMADILRKTSDPRNALGTYLEVCYLDLNGPNNVGTLVDRSGRRRPIRDRRFPAWNPRRDGQLAPAVLARASKLVQDAGLPRAEVQAMFMRSATALRRSLRLPVSPKKAWRQLAKKLPSPRS